MITYIEDILHTMYNMVIMLIKVKVFDTFLKPVSLSCELYGNIIYLLLFVVK